MRGWELRLAESPVTSGELLLRGEENVTVRAKVAIVSVVVGVASLELATRSALRRTSAFFTVSPTVRVDA